MDTLPIVTLVRDVFERYWVKVFLYVGIASLVAFSLMGITGLFTYMRVSDDCRVRAQATQNRLLMDVQSYAARAARLEGEIKGYQTVIFAFARKGKRSSLGMFTVTAYDPKGCEPFNDGITSVGLPVGDGIFAVNPRTIPYGSFLFIPKISKYGIAGDTGAAMRKNPKALDIFVPVRENALAFGRQLLELQLVKFD